MALWQNGRKYPAVVQKMESDGSVSVQVRKNTWRLIESFILKYFKISSSSSTTDMWSLFDRSMCVACSPPTLNLWRTARSSRLYWCPILLVLKLPSKTKCQFIQIRSNSSSRCWWPMEAQKPIPSNHFLLPRFQCVLVFDCWIWCCVSFGEEHTFVFRPRHRSPWEISEIPPDLQRWSTNDM